VRLLFRALRALVWAETKVNYVVIFPPNFQASFALLWPLFRPNLPSSKLGAPSSAETPA